jgi:MerR family copper efflux transcriptional regulator
MRIGELAEKTGLSAKALRYYEEIGVLPEPLRTDSGYRDYGEDAVARVNFIRSAQSVGFTLGEIGEIFAFKDRGETPCRHVQALIERHGRDLSLRIRHLEAMRNDLQRLAKRAKQLSPAEGTFCHIIESADK